MRKISRKRLHQAMLEQRMHSGNTDAKFDPPPEPRIGCAVCGKSCKWVPAEYSDAPDARFGGWYCEPCDVFSETDVEVED